MAAMGVLTALSRPLKRWSNWPQISEKLAIKTALELGQPARIHLGGDSVLEIKPHSATSYYQLGLALSA